MRALKWISNRWRKNTGWLRLSWRVLRFWLDANSSPAPRMQGETGAMPPSNGTGSGRGYSLSRGGSGKPGRGYSLQWSSDIDRILEDYAIGMARIDDVSEALLPIAMNYRDRQRKLRILMGAAAVILLIVAAAVVLAPHRIADGLSIALAWP